ncbi:MFS transporter [Streptomyces sp. NPDC096105]|uniref:MFS transporter n=1 Tax=Streptomyces sp. NPDC096105 TaxID=3366074 RepID=UPI003807AB87
MLRRDRPFRVLVSCCLLVSATTHLVLAGLPYHARHELDRPGFTTVLMAAFVAPALLTTPLWFRLSRSWGEQRCPLPCQGFFAAGRSASPRGRRPDSWSPSCARSSSVCASPASSSSRSPWSRTPSARPTATRPDAPAPTPG